MKRKILMLFLLSFTIYCAYSFSPKKYVLEELGHIAVMNRQQYFYAWGAAGAIEKKRSEELYGDTNPIFYITHFAYSLYEGLEKDGFSIFEEPRTIEEANLMALWLWENAEYSLIVQDTIMREKK